MPAMPWMTVGRTQVVKAVTTRADIERLLSGFSKSIQSAFLKMVDDAAGRIDLDELAALLRAGRTNEAISLAAKSVSGANSNPLVDAVAAATIKAAVDESKRIPAFGEVRFVFDRVNPATVERVDQYGFGLIRQLTSDMRQSIGTVIRAGVAAGRNPLAVAQDIRDVGLGLTQRQAQAVMNYRSSLENLDRDALRRALRDQNFDVKVGQAILDKKPMSAEQIDKMVERYRRRYLKYRSETIARTEGIRALNSGNQEAWKQAAEAEHVDADQVVRIWLYTHDSRTRDAHVLIPSMNPDGVGLDEPFDSIDGPLMYPGDPLAPPEATINCRCAVVYRLSTS